MESPTKQLKRLILQINEQVEQLEADSLSVSTMSIVNEIKRLNNKCNEIVSNLRNKNDCSQETVTVTTLNHLSSVEFETMMDEIVPANISDNNNSGINNDYLIPTKNLTVEEILDKGINAANRIANYSTSTNTKEKTANDLESKTEINNELEVEQDREEKSTKVDKNDFAEYESVDLNAAFSVSDNATVDKNDYARKWLIAECASDNVSKVIEILEKLAKCLNEITLYKPNYGNIFRCSQNTWGHAETYGKATGSDFCKMVKMSPVFTAMKLKRIECLKVLFKKKYNRGNLHLYASVTSTTQIKFFVCLLDGDCRMLEIIGNYICVREE